MKRALFALFAFLWMIDTLATCQFVFVLGLEAEGNPIVRWVIAEYGLGGFAVFKYAVLLWWYLLYERAHVAVHIALCAIMIPVCMLGTIVAASTL